MVADGGGLVAAALHPIVGADTVVAYLSKFSTLVPAALVDAVWLNGTLGARIVMDGEFNTAISFVVESDRISRMYAVRNPYKLSRLDDLTVLAR